MMDANVVNNIYETTIANVYMTGHTNTATNYEFISDKKINNYGSNRRENDPTLTKIQYDNVRNRQFNHS